MSVTVGLAILVRVFLVFHTVSFTTDGDILAPSSGDGATLESYTDIERRNIDFSFFKFHVLDKVDGMLRMSFVEDVELILGKVEDETTDIVGLLPRAQALHGGIQ